MADKLRVTAILVAAMVAGYVGGLMSQANSQAFTPSPPPPITEEVKARSFVLLDSAGKTRGKFGMFSGEPRLDLFDSASKPRAVFTTINGEPKLILYDSAGKIIWATP